MIRLFFGENTYLIEQALARSIADSEIVAEKRDGSELKLADLPDIFAGQTLFGDRRLVVIRGVSENKPIWAALETWLEKLPDETAVVFVESKPDKRTKTYKLIQKLGEIQEFSLPKNTHEAERFVRDEAVASGANLTQDAARKLVSRVGFNPWELVQAVEKLRLLDRSDEAAINQVVEASLDENVFALFEAALKGDGRALHAAIQNSQRQEDPYRLFGLLSSQAYQLAAALAVEQGSKETFAVHPFVLQKLRPYAKRRGRSGVRQVVALVAIADVMLKTTSNDPWTVLEGTLQKIARTA